MQAQYNWEEPLFSWECHVINKTTGTRSFTNNTYTAATTRTAAARRVLGGPA